MDTIRINTYLLDLLNVLALGKSEILHIKILSQNSMQMFQTVFLHKISNVGLLFECLFRL